MTCLNKNIARCLFSKLNILSKCHSKVRIGYWSSWLPFGNRLLIVHIKSLKKCLVQIVYNKQRESNLTRLVIIVVELSLDPYSLPL